MHMYVGPADRGMRSKVEVASEALFNNEKSRMIIMFEENEQNGAQINA